MQKGNFLTIGKPKDKGVALAGGYYYPYLRNENSETFSVLKRCKSESGQRLTNSVCNRASF